MTTTADAQTGDLVTKTTVEITNGRKLTLEYGVVDRTTIRAYTNGQCYAFAKAAAQLLEKKYPDSPYKNLVGVRLENPYPEELEADPHALSHLWHCWAYLPDGFLFDIRGPVDYDAIIEALEWDIETFRTVSYSAAPDLWDQTAVPKANMVAATRFARHVLKGNGYL